MTQTKESPAFPPVNDAIDFVKGIDWSKVRAQLLGGTNALLEFAMQFSENSYVFHEFLYVKLNEKKEEEKE